MYIPRSYEDKKYKEARVSCLKRDGFQCRWPGCGEKKKLQCHHILPWARYPTVRYSVSNLITLCKKHHHLVWRKEEQYAGLLKQLLLKDKYG